MNRPEREVFDRLGVRGLTRVLDDVLDQPTLVRLANACGLRYPGMRTQSQKRDRIVADLVEKAARDESVRKAVLRGIRKATAEAAKAWAELSPEARTMEAEGDSPSPRNGRVGQRLFLLAADAPDERADAALARLLDRETSAPAAAPQEVPASDPESVAREATRLKKKVTELQKKITYLEGQIAKGRETEKSLKRDLMRWKGELAESRMLNEQLRREVQGARGAATEVAAQGPTSPGDAVLTELAGQVRKLGSEQRRLAHRIEKLAEAPPSAAVLPSETLTPILEALGELQRESAALRRERRKDHQDHVARIDEVVGEMRSLRTATQAAVPAPRVPARRKGDPERVGVFVDVQNMYYAARQLKGKLDFDALLQAAVRDRRLIQATAYVVETKEIDQSGFIAMLQQRAFEVRRKTLKVRSDGSMKGDWDMEMALDILDAAPRLDVVVLVSGDGDFTSLVNRVKAMGPRIEVIGFPRNTAKSLLEAADHFQPLDRKFMIRTEPAGSRPPLAPPAPESQESERREAEDQAAADPAP